MDVDMLWVATTLGEVIARKDAEIVRLKKLLEFTPEQRIWGFEIAELERANEQIAALRGLVAALEAERSDEEGAELRRLTADLPKDKTRRVTLSTGRVVTVRNGLPDFSDVFPGRPLVRAIDDKSPEPSAGVVAERVDAVIGDVLAGRTTQKQNRVLREVSERAERVSPKSDAAVGKAVGG